MPTYSIAFLEGQLAVLNINEEGKQEKIEELENLMEETESEASRVAVRLLIQNQRSDLEVTKAHVERVTSLLKLMRNKRRNPLDHSCRCSYCGARP